MNLHGCFLKFHPRSAGLPERTRRGLLSLAVSCHRCLPSQGSELQGLGMSFPLLEDFSGQHPFPNMARLGGECLAEPGSRGIFNNEDGVH